MPSGCIEAKAASTESLRAVKSIGSFENSVVMAPFVAVPFVVVPFVAVAVVGAAAAVAVFNDGGGKGEAETGDTSTAFLCPAPLFFADAMACSTFSSTSIVIL